MLTPITISNAHPRGFAFGITVKGEQVFIPPHIVGKRVLVTGQTKIVKVVTNPDKHYRDRTQWIAVAFEEDDVEVIEPDLTIDEAIYDWIGEADYVTTAELSDKLEIDIKVAAFCAERLFDAGRIAKAEVYHRVGLDQPTMRLWALSAADFAGDDNE